MLAKVSLSVAKRMLEPRAVFFIIMTPHGGLWVAVFLWVKGKFWVKLSLRYRKPLRRW